MEDEKELTISRTYVHFWHPNGSFLLREGTDIDQFSDLLEKILFAPSLRKKAALYPQLRSTLVPPPDAPSDEESVKRFYQRALFIISSVTTAVPSASAEENVPVVKRLRSTTLKLEGKSYVLCVYSAEPKNPLLASSPLEAEAKQQKGVEGGEEEVTADTTRTPTEPPRIEYPKASTSVSCPSVPLHPQITPDSSEQLLGAHFVDRGRPKVETAQGVNKRRRLLMETTEGRENEEPMDPFRWLQEELVALSKENGALRSENSMLRIMGPPLSAVSPPDYPGMDIIRDISTTSTATVYQARFGNEIVAVKIYRSPPHSYELMFLLKNLQHENVIKIKDVLQLSAPCLIMEYIPGGNLAALLHHRKLSAQEVTRMALGIARGLEFLHKHNVIHRDINSSNILLKENLEPVITGFELALGSTTKISESADLNLGYAAYVAPELLVGKPFDNKVDIYSFGILMWEMYSGQMPDSNVPQARVVMGYRPPIDNKWDQFLTAVMQQCWQHLAVVRPSAEEIVQQLSSVAPTSQTELIGYSISLRPWTDEEEVSE